MSATEMIGQTLNNRYTINKRLGKGAMGTVYRAVDAQTGQDVAVKIIARELAFDPDMLERFRREGEALRQLRHPNIVGFVDAFQYDEHYAIVLEYVSGGSLHELVRQGPMPLERAQRMALELCDAFTRAHHLNIVHRDVKPENVLLDSGGTPKLTDFGVARLVSNGNRLTGTGTQIGTPYYMSPEAWEGKPLDAQADIWSLGVVIYEMLSGEVPFGGETLVAVMNKVLTAPLPDLKTKRPDVPDGLAQIVKRMLTRDRADRYRSMREVAADLERGGPMNGLATPQPLTTPAYAPPTRKVPAGKTPPRAAAHNGLAIIGVILGLLGVIAGPGLLLSATENYLKGPLWIVAAAVLAAAVAAGLWGLRKERSQPSRWGRLEAGLGVGLGGLAGVAFLAIGFITVAPRSIGGVQATPSPVFVTEGTVGPILFEDNFDSGPSPRWDFQPQRWDTTTLDGRTVLNSVPAERNSFASLHAEDWTDYAAQFDFKFLKPDEHNAYYFYLRVRTTDCPPTVQALDNYVALITTDVVELRDESCETQMQETVTRNDRNIEAGGWHTAQVIVIGNRLRLLVDGQQFIDYTDPESPHLNGAISLDIENNVELAIDNFRVNKIIPGESAAAPVATSAPVYITEGASGEVLFEDDFENGLSPEWDELDPEWRVETVDGRAVLHGAGPKDGNFAVITYEDWADFTLQTDFNFIGVSQTNNYHISINVRGNDCPPEVHWLSTYSIFITYDAITLDKSTCDTPREWAVLDSVERTTAPREWHALQITAVGNRIQVFLDGEQIIDHLDTDSPISAGNVALATVDGAEALFDNVRVTEIIPGLACAPGETKLFSDDFEDGDTQGWTLAPGEGAMKWTVETESDGNHVLVGGGHQWATVGDKSAWTDYSLQLRVHTVNGDTHLNIRNDEGRYDISYPNGTLSRGHPGEPVVPFQMPRDDQWRTILMSAVGAHVEVWQDGEMVAEYDDPLPFLKGNVGLENLSGTVWYDDVLVCSASAESTAPAATASPPDAVSAALADPWGAVVIPTGVSIVLNVASDLSGPLGTDQRDAVQLAVEERGTIAGFSVTLSSIDDKCSSEGGQAAARTMTETGQVVAIVGTTCSNAMSAAMPILENAHIVVISPSTSGTDLSQNGWLVFNRLALADALNPGGSPVADPNSAVYKEFAAKLKEKFGRDCCAPFAAEAYDAAIILLNAIESVAVADETGQLIIPRQALAQVVRSTKDYEGLSGKITFEANGDRAPEP